MNNFRYKLHAKGSLIKTLTNPPLLHVVFYFLKQKPLEIDRISRGII